MEEFDDLPRRYKQKYVSNLPNKLLDLATRRLRKRQYTPKPVASTPPVRGTGKRTKPVDK